jgi:predicted nuclease with TOPRIM domain
MEMEMEMDRERSREVERVRRRAMRIEERAFELLGAFARLRGHIDALEAEIEAESEETAEIDWPDGREIAP